MVMEIKALKAQVQQAAQERQVDATVRTVARSGSADEARINFRRVLTLPDGATLDVHATFGAGTNSASVRHRTHGLVYEALDYGRHLQCYRAGAWLAALEAEAARVKGVAVAEDLVRRAQWELEERGVFMPLGG